MSREEWESDIDIIVSSLRKQHLAVFCGSGATADATKTTWADLFEEKIAPSGTTENDYYRLAQYYSMTHGRTNLVNTIANAFDNVTDESAHINQLVKLPIYEFWTTNYDCIIEDTITKKTSFIPSVIINSENLHKINENKRYKVFKMNGTIKDGTSMIITMEDYEKYKSGQRLFLEFLKKELVLKTFAFIGYSFDDQLVLDCLREIKQSFPSLGHYHYQFVRVKGNDREYHKRTAGRFFENNYNIRTIYIDEFSEIDSVLEEIYHRYISKNVFISGSFRDLPRCEEDRANDICKALVERLLDNGYNIYSGDGKRLGSYVISNASKKLMNTNDAFIGNRLKIMPYIDHTFKGIDARNAERIRLINCMIQDCQTAIFLYGQSENGTNSQGVKAEFEEAKNRKMWTIPIPKTGFMAEELFNNVQSALPPYLEKYNERLKADIPPDDLARLIVDIIKSANLAT